MWKRLIDAASSGDCMILNGLLQEDPKIIERIPSWDSLETPLHLASMFGHVQFVQHILEVNSSSTSLKQLNQLNQDGYSPLHLAVGNAHLDMVMALLDFGNMHSVVEVLCINKDKDGKTPLHGATIRGDLEIISALVGACPESVFELTIQEETILHLAVKHNKCDAFMVLVQQVNFGEIFNFPDREGNTVFHLAAARKQFQIIEYLISQTCLKINAVNSYGLTALDIFVICSSNSIEIKIAEMIRYAGGQNTINQIQPGFTTSRQLQTNQICTNHQNGNRPDSSGLIVMASLIAAATFEVALNPPGGFWQDWDQNINRTTTTTTTTTANFGAESAANHRPGNAILYDLNRDQFKCFLFCNAQVFVTSISIIVALISPKTLKFEFSKLFVARMATLLLVIMFMMLFYQAEKLTTQGKSPAEPAAVISFLFWSALNICFACSPLIATTWNMLRKRGK